MANINELREQRAAIVARMRELVNTAENENRAMSAEEETNYNTANADAETLRRRIERMEQMAGFERELGDGASEERVRQLRMGGEAHGGASDREARQAIARYIYSGAVDPHHMRADEERGGSVELRTALGVTMAAAGAYLAPTQLEKQLIEYIGNMNVIRRLADVRSSKTNVDIPFAATHVQAYHIAEGADFTASTPTFSKKTLKAFKTGALAYVSHEALEDAVINLETFFRDEFGMAFADLEEADFISGAGTTEPTGILTGGTLGVTAAGTAAVTAEELIDLQHSLKQAYRKNAVWIMNDATAKALRKLKDTTGQFLWQPGLQEGKPDVLLGRPVYYSDSMPAMGAGKKAVVFGDLKKFRILDRSGLYVQRLNEVAATSGQVGFLSYRRYDSNVMVPEAIKYLAMHA